MGETYFLFGLTKLQVMKSTGGGVGVYSNLSWVQTSSQKFQTPPKSKLAKMQIYNPCANYV